MIRFSIIFLMLISVLLMATGQDISNMKENTWGTPKELVNENGILVPVYDFEGFRPILSCDNDTIYILNFWATWCKPCIEELPHFIRLSEEMKSDSMRFVFVSLDFRRNLETTVIPFLKARNMTQNVILLNDPNANAWIDQIDPEWSGALPATLIYRNNLKSFHEKSLSYEELKSIINHFKNL